MKYSDVQGIIALLCVIAGNTAPMLGGLFYFMAFFFLVRGAWLDHKGR